MLSLFDAWFSEFVNDSYSGEENAAYWRMVRMNDARFNLGVPSIFH